MCGNFFPNLSSVISEKCFLPPIFFLDSDSPCSDLLFPHSLKPRKNVVVLETQLSGDAQNICAVTKGGTILNRKYLTRKPFPKLGFQGGP